MMTITVPRGWRVSVTYRNTTSVAQSLVIVAQGTTPLPTSGFAPAITGTSTANPAVGQARGAQHFSFTANPVGQYLLVSGVPGHATAGLWDHFAVSASAQAPAVTRG